MGTKLRRQYTAEFKRQAVKMAKEIGQRKAAQSLGIVPANIRNWKKADLPPRESGPSESLETENRRLREENIRLQKVNRILREAAAFFSQDHLK